MTEHHEHGESTVRAVVYTTGSPVQPQMIAHGSESAIVIIPRSDGHTMTFDLTATVPGVEITTDGDGAAVQHLIAAIPGQVAAMLTPCCSGMEVGETRAEVRGYRDGVADVEDLRGEL